VLGLSRLRTAALNKIKNSYYGQNSRVGRSFMISIMIGGHFLLIKEVHVMEMIIKYIDMI
jgi:hypothetical protein